MDTNGAARRALLRGAFVGGATSAIAAVAMPAEAATWTPRTIHARDLRVGDMLGGPYGAVVRVHSLLRLANGNVRIRYTNSQTTGSKELPLDSKFDVRGYPADRRFVVFARGIGVAAVRIGPEPKEMVIPIVDGGQP